MMFHNRNVFTALGSLWIAGLTSLIAAQNPDFSPVHQSTPELKIRVYGFPGLSASVLGGAYKEATRMLESVAIQLTWVDCTARTLTPSCAAPQLPTDLTLRIIPEPLPPASTRALGMTASTGDSAAAFIFYDRVVAQRTHTRLLPAILGRVMAHEITHILLPDQDHSELGLMRGQWSPDDLRSTSGACLGLPVRSVALMRSEALRRVLVAGRAN